MTTGAAPAGAAAAAGGVRAGGRGGPAEAPGPFVGPSPTTERTLIYQFDGNVRGGRTGGQAPARNLLHPVFADPFPPRSATADPLTSAAPLLA